MKKIIIKRKKRNDKNKKRKKIYEKNEWNKIFTLRRELE